MIEKRDIEALAHRIGVEFRPARVVLFGSYAYGTPTPDSDVDLLVVMPYEGRGTAQALEIMRRVQPRIPVDLVVRSPQELRSRLACDDFFLREITDRGEVLYETPDA